MRFLVVGKFVRGANLNDTIRIQARGSRLWTSFVVDFKAAMRSKEQDLNGVKHLVDEVKYEGDFEETVRSGRSDGFRAGLQKKKEKKKGELQSPEGCVRKAEFERVNDSDSGVDDDCGHSRELHDEVFLEGSSDVCDSGKHQPGQRDYLLRSERWVRYLPAK
jgi:hypothetical protein